MELHQLVYFEAVARHQHFTRAAGELRVAQPSVSQQIRKLEGELGAPLFHRTRRGAELTEAGRLLLPRARAALEELAAARAEVQSLSALERGTLRVGAPPSVGTHVFPPALARFRERYPGIALVFREGGSHSLVQRLVEGELDLAVVIQAHPPARRLVSPPPAPLPGGPSPHPVLTTEPLLEERLRLAVPPGHPLAGRGGKGSGGSGPRAGRREVPVALSELREEPFVLLREGTYDLRDQTLAACRRAGFEPRVALDGGEMDSVLRFVAAGLGVAILPETVLRRGADGAPAGAPTGGGPDLLSLPLSDPDLRRTLVLARRRDRAYAPAARAFAALLRQELEALPSGGASAVGEAPGEENPLSPTSVQGS
jgi:DNA-binding transcriptional LysR family regulator